METRSGLDVAFTRATLPRRMSSSFVRPTNGIVRRADRVVSASTG
jgi:hypothetical protein